MYCPALERAYPWKLHSWDIGEKAKQNSARNNTNCSKCFQFLWNSSNWTWFFNVLTFARSLGRCWKPRPPASVFNNSLGTWRMFMHEKPCLIPILWNGKYCRPWEDSNFRSCHALFTYAKLSEKRMHQILGQSTWHKDSAHEHVKLKQLSFLVAETYIGFTAYRNLHSFLLPYRNLHSFLMPYRNLHSFLMPYRNLHSSLLPYRNLHSFLLAISIAKVSHCMDLDITMANTRTLTWQKVPYLS